MAAIYITIRREGNLQVPLPSPPAIHSTRDTPFKHLNPTEQLLNSHSLRCVQSERSERLLAMQYMCEPCSSAVQTVCTRFTENFPLEDNRPCSFK